MKQLFDSIIFDMDGVLVSNSSYVNAIKKTVERYCPLREMQTAYIEEIKNITGFNNDWDTSYALIQLLGNNVPVERFANEVKLITTEVRTTSLYRSIRDTFQTYYVGNNNSGHISTESLLIRLPILQRLAKQYILGIATSRPRAEALFAASNLGLSPGYFSVETIVAKEDAPREKPFPDPLLLAKARMRVSNPVYIGDTINDTVAAAAAGMPCIFVGSRDLGDWQIQNPNQIVEVLL